MPDSAEMTALRTWLSDSGYAFEVEVGRVLSRSDWSVRHSIMYRPPYGIGDGGMREIDIVATIGSAGSQGYCDTPDDQSPADTPEQVTEYLRVGSPFVFKFAIECKRSKGRPWVAFASGDQMWNVGTAPLGPGEFGLLEPEVLDLGLRFVVPERNVHSIVQALTADAKQNTAFAALQSAALAAAALTEENATEVLRAEKFDAPLIVICLPMVVLSSSIYEFHVSNSGDSVLEPIRFVSVPIPDPLCPSREIAVTVVSMEALADVARSIRTEALDVVRVLRPRYQHVREEYRASHTSGAKRTLRLRH